VSRVLGIEVVAHQIRLVLGEVAGGVLRVYDFALEDRLTANQENLAQQLEGTVGRRGWGSNPVALALNGPGVVHRLQDFPSMPLNELGLVVRREMRTMGGGEEAALDWEITNETVSGDLKQLKVLVAMAPRRQVDECLTLLKACHLRAALITTSPTSLLRVLRFVQRGEGGQNVFLYLGRDDGYLLGTDSGIWSFYREFSSGFSGEGMETEVMREAHRALLYHRQRFPEGREIHFLLSGEQELGALKEGLERETGCEAEIVAPGPALDLSALRDRAEDFRQMFPSFIIPLGLVAADFENGINLIPESARPARRLWPRIDWSFIYRPVPMGLAVLLLFAVVGLILRVETRYEGLLAERRSLLAQWRPTIKAAETSRVLTEGQRLLDESLGASQGRLAIPSWVRLFKALGLFAPPELILTEMALRSGDDGWGLNLKGEVVAGDAYAAQVAFNEFYRHLKESVGMEALELLPLRVTSFTESTEDQGNGVSGVPLAGGPTQGEKDLPAVARTKIEFEVRGRLKGFF